MATIDEKYQALQETLDRMESVLVAFSGGVDSTLLLKVAHDRLGEKAGAITIDAPFHSRSEIADAARLAGVIGARHLVLNAHELELDQLADNPPDRCYVCKTAVFSLCRDLARQHGYRVLADGSNADDLGDYRPGRRALQELEVASPLLEVGLTKAEIRELSRRLELETWNKPALACLLTRFPHGEQITPESLQRVERCEDYLRGLGFGLLRVRSHGDTARLELTGTELVRLMEEGLRGEVTRFFHAAGFEFVTVDLDGYRCGSMNPSNTSEQRQ